MGGDREKQAEFVWLRPSGFSAGIGIVAVFFISVAINWLLIQSVVNQSPGDMADFVVIEALGPIANALILIFGWCFFPMMWRRAGGAWAISFLVAATTFPLSGYGLEVYLIVGDHLH